MTDPRVSAVEENLLTQFELVAASGIVTPLPDTDLVAYASDVPFPLFNVISGARFAAGAEAGRAAEVVDGYLERGRPFLWWATPSTMTPETDAVLRSRGIEPSPEPGMHLALDEDVDPRTAPGVEVSVSGPTPELLDVMVAGFGFPYLSSSCCATFELSNAPQAAIAAHSAARPIHRTRIHGSCPRIASGASAIDPNGVNIG